MKKLFTVSCLLLTIAFPVQQARAQVDFGIRGGVNFATLNNTDLNVGTRTGFQVGVFAEISLYDNLIALQPELLYTQKGYETDAGREVKLSYIEIPILLDFKYLLDSPVSPHVYFGPYVGINVAAEAENIKVVPRIASVPFFPEEQASDVTLGVMVGGGIEISHFDVGIRYSAGLTPAFENNNVSAKNGVFSIVAGYSF